VSSEENLLRARFNFAVRRRCFGSNKKEFRRSEKKSADREKFGENS
jgi:hypothetical protein